MTRVVIESDVDCLPLIEMRLAMRGIMYLTSLKGLGSPAPRESGIDIPQQDGEYSPSRLTSGGRNISIGGAVRGCSSVEAAGFEDRVCDLMARDLKVTVEDAHGRRHYRGWLADDPEPSMFSGEQVFTFTLIVHIPDPLKYGDPVVFLPSGGLLRVENAGRVGSWPSVHVDGGVTALSLSLGSRTVKWSGNANVLDLDLRDMIPSAGVASGQAFRIPPGASIIPVSLSGGGSLSMTVFPAWR
jgi:hypothetical protein